MFCLEFLEDFETMIEKGWRRLQLADSLSTLTSPSSGTDVTPLKETQMLRLALLSFPWCL
jgi:hypothetical protein